MDIKRRLHDAVKACTGGERGAALITAMLFLVILTALGMASIVTSTAEMKIARNYRLNILAMDYANAGVQAAMAAMDAGTVGNLASTYNIPDPDKTWSVSSAYISPALHDISYDVLVEYRKEDTAHWRDMPGGDNTDEEVVGYSVDCGYQNAPYATWDKSMPIFKVKSVGKVMKDGKTIATATVITENTLNIMNVDAPAALYSTNCVQQGGSSGISGTDEGGCNGADMPDVMTNCTSVDPHTGNAIDPANPGEDPQYGVEKTFQDVFGMSYEQLISQRDRIITGAECNTNEGKDPTRGSTYDNPMIVYVDCDDYTMNASYVGYGVLICKGNLTANGGANWQGLVYVGGDLDLMGTYDFEGSVYVAGAVSAAKIAGDGNISYDRCKIDDLLKNLAKTKVINWKREYKYDAIYE